jgi:hypothetical protein
MMTDNPFSPVHVAGHYGYVQVTPTVVERNAGFREAYMIVDFARIEEDREPAFVFADAVCSRQAAIAHAREQHRYEVEGGERLNSLAIREWAEEIVAGR